MKKNQFKMSFLAAMFLGSGAYAGLIKGATPPLEPLAPDLLRQFAYGGWNLDNVEVKIVSDSNFSQEIAGSDFDESDGTYTTMDGSMSFESMISTGAEVRGLLHGKDWPVGEPSGIKVINGDTATKHGKAQNCIMTTSYLSLEDNPFDVYGYLDGENPTPTICSSAFQTHKRFKINMMPATVATLDANRYGQPIELVFNLETGDTSTQRYQVFQKINNYTGKRLDGYKIEVLDATDSVNANIKFSLLISDDPSEDESGDVATFSRGLWGPKDDKVFIPPRFETDGFFDKVRAGFSVIGDNTNTLTGGLPTLKSNYEALFGLWLPSKWAPQGIFHDDDRDPSTDAELVAFWGTIPNAPVGTAPAWHKGKDYDLSNGDQSWAEPTPQELLTWTIDPWYAKDVIEDTLNLGLDYVVSIGANSSIGSQFKIRITPRVAVDQTPPNYIEDDNTTYIEPPTSYVATAGVVTISPKPTFTPGTALYVGVADADLNIYPLEKETVSITVKADTGDSETLMLTETALDSGMFSATLPTENSGISPIANNGSMSVIEDTVVTATYVDTHYGDEGTTVTLTATTTAKTPVAPAVPNASDGGGCTFNPKSRGVDTTVLLMLAMGLLYPFRRRFIK